jgi:UDP-2-acetamido-3-amino-2,3-dideoxy-glucuronate N-acetyltransferase
MLQPTGSGSIVVDEKTGKGVIVGKDVFFGENIVVWNYVVIGDGSKIGEGTHIGSFCDIGRDVLVGKKCNVQAHVTISNGCRIGDNVFIGPNTSLLNDKYPDSIHLKPVRLENGSIIGGSVTILPGVTVGEESVVGAGSVVAKDVPPKTVVVGIPARVIMTLAEYRKKQRENL